MHEYSQQKLFIMFNTKKIKHGLFPIQVFEFILNIPSDLLMKP